jgi:hypothetical protein
MTRSAVPPGYRREQALREQLDELHAEVERLRSILPSVNDPILHEHSQALAEAAAGVVHAYRNSTHSGAALADDLASLMAAARAIRVPPQDPDLGRTQTLEQLRTAKGLIVSALQDALDTARELGLYPRRPSVRQELPMMEVSRIDNQALFEGITRRLDEVVERLDALASAEAEPTGFPQQTGLLNFYFGAMRVEADLTRLHLTVGEKAVDLGALAHSVEVIAELTGDFVATIRAWIGRVSNTVARIAGEVEERVRRLVTGTRTTAKWIVRKSRTIQVSFDPDDPECVTQVFVYAPPDNRIVAEATSIRVQVSSKSNLTLKDVLAHITKIEKRVGGGAWETSNSPAIQTTWTDTDGDKTEIPSSSIKHVNVLHISHTDNRLRVWKRNLPSSLARFLYDAATYRLTVLVTAEGVRRQTRIELLWDGRWDTLKVCAAP